MVITPVDIEIIFGKVVIKALFATNGAYNFYLCKKNICFDFINFSLGNFIEIVF